ncbi:MAG: hypothetical protein UIG59_04540, partial [Acutalibacteraceae bacterium]|nr:hypothetical protein [Acutalibacteraceae bacterium]
AERRYPLCFSGKTALAKRGEHIGKISAEFVYAYPPGSPIIAPGEVITKEVSDYIDFLFSRGAQIYSDSGNYPDFLLTFAEND